MPSLNTKLASAPNTTSNYVLKATTSTTIGNSLIFDNGTNVGIGTASPFAIADTNLSVNGTTSSAIQLGFNGTRYGQFYTDSGEIRLSAVANLPLTFYSNNLERMRITSGGELLINATTNGAPNLGYQLGVRGTNANSLISIALANQTLSTQGSYIGLDGTVGYIHMIDNKPWIFSTNNTERMRITNIGHLLIGTSTDLTFTGVWDNGVTRIGRGGLLFSYRDNAENFMISQNYYINSSGTDVRIEAVPASNIYMASGSMYFRTCGTGTAGSTISWNNPLVLTSGGRTIMNSTTDRGYTLQVNGDVNSYAVELRQSNNNANYDLLTLTHEATSGNRRMVIFNVGGIGTVGTIISTNSSTTYNTNSDYRLKQDLKDYNGLDLVNSIKTYDFEWVTDDSRMYGVLAHELQEVIPYAVYGEKDEVDDNGKPKMQGVDYSKIVPVLIKAIQELKAEVDTLKQLVK